MSKYTLYSTSMPDAEKAGKKNRRYYIVFTLLLILLSQLPNYCNSMRSLKISVPLYITVAISIAGVLIFLFSKLRAMSGSLRKIGRIELTQSGVRKSIGDLSERIDFSSIKKMELDDYFKDVSIFRNFDARTKKLSITKNDLSKETFIISFKPLDYSKISIEDSVRTIGKITGIEVVI